MLRARRAHRDRDDAGAIMIIVSLVVALVIVPVGALAIDLGNAYARTAGLQRDADEAATAAAIELARLQRDELSGSTALTAARTKAVDVLCANATAADNWTGSAGPCQNRGWAGDGNLTNGEVVFYTGAPSAQHVYGAGQQTDGTGAAALVTGVRVLTPPSRVEYGLASAFSGTDHVDPQRAATAALFTALPRAGVLPMFLTLGTGGAGETGVFCARSAPMQVWQPTYPGPATSPCSPTNAATIGSVARGYLDVRRSASAEDAHRAVWNAAVGADAAHLPVVGQSVTPMPQHWPVTALLRDLQPGLFGGSDSYGAPGRLTSAPCTAGGGTATTSSGPFSGVEGAYLGDFVDTRIGARTAFKTLVTSGTAPTTAQGGWLSSSVLRCGRLAVVPVIAVLPPLPYGGLTGTSYRVTGLRMVWLDDRMWSGDAPVATATCLQRGFYWADPNNQNICETALRAMTGYVLDPRLLPATVAGSDAASTAPYLGSGLPAVIHLIRDVGDPPPG